MTRPATIGVFGSTGRMGKAVIAEIAGQFAAEAELAAAVSTRSGGIVDLADVDVIIDFSLPAGTALLVDWLHDQDRAVPALVSGTTGLNDDTLQRLAALGDTTRVIHSTNFSAGVAALASILEQATPLLRKLGYSPVLTETHHRHKLDAPSGTAKTLAERMGADDMPIHSVRAGDVIGKHSVAFYGPLDEITIDHDARDRGLFARGAVDAALWLARQTESEGFFTMPAYFQQRYLGSDD